MKHTGGSASFFKTFRETLIANLFNIGGLLAGFLVASHLGIFNLSPWALALFPGVIGSKIVIDGLLSGQLSTALHLGIVYPKLFGNTKSFYNLIASIIVLTLITSGIMSAISLIFGYLFWGVTLFDFSAILTVIVAAMALGLTSLIMTVKASFFSFKKGLDPDIIVYPIVSTVTTIFVTLCYVVALTLFFSYPEGVWVIALLGVVHLCIALYISLKNLREPEFIKIIHESLVGLIIVAFIVNVTGTILKGINIYLNPPNEIYIMYPVLISIVSGVGSVVGSTAITKLALGMLKPKISSITNHTKTVFTAWLASITIFILLPVLALLLKGRFSLTAFYGLTIALLLANVIAVLLVVFFSFALSILTFQKGLDPGTFVNPIETSFAASITSIALFAALILVGNL